MSVRPVKLDGHETILVCEDDEGVRNLAVEILQQAGYYVISAPDAAQALEISSRFPARIDLLLTDVIMPQMNGKELSENLSTQRPELRTLFVSGYASSVIASQGIEQSSSPFLEKPFKRDSLLEKVRLTLDS